MKLFEMFVHSRSTKGILIIISLFTIVFFLRAVSFAYSIWDWDETLFLIMARDWLNGNLFYTLTWDHKPPGIYLIFAIAQFIFGQTVFAIRIAAIISVNASAYLLYRFGKDIFKSNSFGVFIAFLYSFFGSIGIGLASHIELFFAPVVIASFYLVFKIIDTHKIECKKSFLISILFGITFIIKYITIFSFISLLVILFILIYGFFHQTKNKFIYAASIVLLLFAFYSPLKGHIKLNLYTFSNLNTSEKTDSPRFISSYLKNHPEIPEQYIYVVDYEPVIYYLTNTIRPTKYIFPPFLTEKHFFNVAGINPMKELDSIMKHKPVYVIKQTDRKNDPFYEKLNKYLLSDYYNEVRNRQH